MVDIDHLTVTGPPVKVLPILSPVVFSLGRSLTTGVMNNYTLICTGPFVVQIPCDYKYSLAEKINISFGYELTVSADPRLLHNFASRRVGTLDLVKWLGEIGCQTCTATMYAFKAQVGGLQIVVDSLLAEGCEVIIDVGVEEVPSHTETNFIPLVKLIDEWKTFWPLHNRKVHNAYIPYQCLITGRNNMFGGVELVKSNAIGTVHDMQKVIVYQKTTHFWKAATESNVVSIPNNFLTLKNSKKYMERILGYMENMGPLCKVLRYEMRIVVQNSLNYTVSKVLNTYLPIVKKSVVIYEMPLENLVVLSNHFLSHFGKVFTGTRDNTALNEEQKVIYCTLMSTLGVSNGKFNQVLLQPSNLQALKELMMNCFPDSGFLPMDHVLNRIMSEIIPNKKIKIVDKFWQLRYSLEPLPEPTPQYNVFVEDIESLEAYHPQQEEIMQNEEQMEERYSAEDELRDQMIQKVVVFSWRNGVRACTKRGGTARTGSSPEELIGRLMEVYGADFEDYLVCHEEPDPENTTTAFTTMNMETFIPDLMFPADMNETNLNAQLEGGNTETTARDSNMNDTAELVEVHRESVLNPSSNNALLSQEASSSIDTTQLNVARAPGTEEKGPVSSIDILMRNARRKTRRLVNPTQNLANETNYDERKQAARAIPLLPGTKRKKRSTRYPSDGSSESTFG